MIWQCLSHLCMYADIGGHVLEIGRVGNAGIDHCAVVHEILGKTAIFLTPSSFEIKSYPKFWIHSAESFSIYFCFNSDRFCFTTRVCLKEKVMSEV